MTTVVINAISIREGGSMVVLRELLGGMAALRPQWRWRVVVNSKATGPLPELSNVEYLRFPRVDQSGLKTRLWYETGLPALLRKSDAELLFSTTNYLPWKKLPCPSLLLVQHAGHFSPLFRQLTEARLGWAGRLAWRLKGRWVRSSVRNADAVTLQTAALAQQVAQEAAVAGSRLRVIPHGPGQTVVQSAAVAPPPVGGNFRIGYITKYGVQKNFAVLFEAMDRLKGKAMPPTLVLTLSETEAGNRAVLEKAKQLGLMDGIENHGELSVAGIDRLYQSLHTFVFPSLCESFGFPMVEAMAHGLPLLVADTASNIEVAGAGGVAFPAHDAASLAGEIERLMDEPAWFRERAEASLVRAAAFDWKKAAVDTLALMEELISAGTTKA